MANSKDGVNVSKEKRNEAEAASGSMDSTAGLGQDAALQDTASQTPDLSERDASIKPFAHQARAFALWFYVLAFLAVDVLGVMLLQWSVTMVEPFSSFLNFVGLMFTAHNFVFLLNVLVLGVIYFAVLALINRFWVATPVFITLVTIVSVVERMKVSVRNETILPSDLKMAGTNTGNLTEFIPHGSGRLLVKISLFLLVFILLCVLMAHHDGKAQLLARSNRWVGKNLGTYVTARILIFLLPAGLVAAYASSLGTVGTWSYNLSVGIGDGPRLWDSVEDAQGNGTLIGFLRFTNPKVMDMPKGYSKATMTKIAEKYSQAATSINKDRSEYLTDSSVIMILSESYSDPTRVPGLKLNKDPMPNIRAIKKSTTSGLMLSSGYGGGTANLEFQAITGLSMANFDASLSSPYQQLVGSMTWTPTFNQLWNQNGMGSLAFHPYYSSMYSRQQNYKKFGFAKFWTLTGPQYIEYQDKIDDSPYVSDESSYKSVLEQVSAAQGSKFYQLVTMQNHMSYDNWYENNEFSATSTTDMPLGADETGQINTYAKGVNYTDKSTKEFLAKLNKLNKPVTVIFYGDHLPGIYASASRDTNNSVALHETDYFIWSNKASDSSGHKLSADDAAYTSPNFLMAQTAQHMDAKVSPYLAFLTQLHDAVAAMEPPVANRIQQWYRIPEGQSLNLDSDGNQIDTAKLSAADKQLLKDYKLIQYDITAGKNYLKGSGFMQTPTKESEEAAAKKAAEEKAAQEAAAKKAAADAKKSKDKSDEDTVTKKDSESDSSGE